MCINWSVGYSIRPIFVARCYGKCYVCYLLLNTDCTISSVLSSVDNLRAGEDVETCGMRQEGILPGGWNSCFSTHWHQNCSRVDVACPLKNPHISSELDQGFELCGPLNELPPHLHFYYLLRGDFGMSGIDFLTKCHQNCSGVVATCPLTNL